MGSPARVLPLERRSMLQINNLTFRIGGRLLLEGASASLPDGHKVGLVGRNGTGKSTLLKLILGDLISEVGLGQRAEKRPHRHGGAGSPGRA